MVKMKNLYMIACVSKDNGLGKDGGLLWQFPEDMQFFRETTIGSVVVMGRKTFESIGRPLPKRENVVLSRQDVPGVLTFHTQAELDEYLESAEGAKFIIGGASLYEMYLDKAEKIYLTEVAAVKPADTYFPEFDKARYLRKVLKTGQQSNINYEIVVYERQK